MPKERNDVGEQIAELLLLSKGVWAVVLDGEPCRIVNLAPGVIGKLQRDFDAQWELIIRYPLQYLDLAEAIVGAVAEKLGKESPLPITDTADLMALFVKLDDDLPETPRLEHDEDDEVVDPTSAT